MPAPNKEDTKTKPDESKTGINDSEGPAADSSSDQRQDSGRSSTEPKTVDPEHQKKLDASSSAATQRSERMKTAVEGWLNEQKKFKEDVEKSKGVVQVYIGQSYGTAASGRKDTIACWTIARDYLLANSEVACTKMLTNLRRQTEKFQNGTDRTPLSREVLRQYEMALKDYDIYKNANFNFGSWLNKAGFSLNKYYKQNPASEQSEALRHAQEWERIAFNWLSNFYSGQLVKVSRWAVTTSNQQGFISYIQAVARKGYYCRFVLSFEGPTGAHAIGLWMNRGGRPNNFSIVDTETGVCDFQEREHFLTYFKDVLFSSQIAGTTYISIHRLKMPSIAA